MKIIKLDTSFYAENQTIENALDNYGSYWGEKVRGYGVVIININSLTFAIPLRSNIQHNGAYITQKKSKHNPTSKGLDFSKALLIKNEKYITDVLYRISPQIHKKLYNKSHYISQKFEKYVESYIHACNKQDENILNDDLYRYTTLVNYHNELGII